MTKSHQELALSLHSCERGEEKGVASRSGQSPSEGLVESGWGINSSYLSGAAGTETLGHAATSPVEYVENSKGSRGRGVLGGTLAEEASETEI